MPDADYGERSLGREVARGRDDWPEPGHVGSSQAFWVLGAGAHISMSGTGTLILTIRAWAGLQPPDRVLLGRALPELPSTTALTRRRTVWPLCCSAPPGSLCSSHLHP